MSLDESARIFDGIRVLDIPYFSDQRGIFSKIMSFEAMKVQNIDLQIMQINHSFTSEIGSIRGMHLQKSPYAEKKLITCIRGAVFDVALDLRKDSKTFLNYFSIELNARSKRSVLIPEGFAHGFQVLKKDTEMLYVHSQEYKVEYEEGFNPLDPAFDIKWPLVTGLISKKDSLHEMVGKNFQGLEL